jgi:hypothetical protein
MKLPRTYYAVEVTEKGKYESPRIYCRCGQLGGSGRMGLAGAAPFPNCLARLSRLKSSDRRAVITTHSVVKSFKVMIVSATRRLYRFELSLGFSEALQSALPPGNWPWADLNLRKVES